MDTENNIKEISDFRIGSIKSSIYELRQNLLVGQLKEELEELKFENSELKYENSELKHENKLLNGETNK